MHILTSIYQRIEKKLPALKEAKRKQKWAKMTEIQKRQYEKSKYGPYPEWNALHLVASKPAFSFKEAKVLHNEVLRLLLNKKPALNKVNLDDETPLHLAVNVKNIDIAKSLIGAGVDVNMVRFPSLAMSGNFVLLWKYQQSNFFVALVAR